MFWPNPLAKAHGTQGGGALSKQPPKSKPVGFGVQVRRLRAEGPKLVNHQSLTRHSKTNRVSTRQGNRGASPDPRPPKVPQRKPKNLRGQCVHEGHEKSIKWPPIDLPSKGKPLGSLQAFSCQVPSGLAAQICPNLVSHWCTGGSMQSTGPGNGAQHVNFGRITSTTRF